MRRFAAGVAAALVLAGCDARSPHREAAHAPPASAEEARMGAAAAFDSAPAPEPSDPAAAMAPLLAYEHDAALELPARAVEPAMRAHEQACVAAGPAVCQVVAASLSTYAEDQVSAHLTLRAEPGWLARFRQGLQPGAERAGGRLRSESVTAQDLTRDIVDGEARLKALTTLRDRLQQILASRPGKLTELLEVERELARVQGELDALRSVVAVMRQRVDTSILRIAYETKPTAVTGGTFEPISNAIAGFLGVSAQVVAFLITAFAIAVPAAIVLIPLGWIAARLWRKARRTAAVEKGE